MTNEVKKCTRCKQEKSIVQFYKDASRPGGIGYTCKQCSRAHETAKRAKHTPTEEDRQKERERNKRRRAAMTPQQRQLRNAKMAENRAKRREAIREQSAIYNARASERRIASAQQYVKSHPDRYAAAIALKDAVRRGDMPSARNCQCADCGGQARHYHHESYAPEHWLDVVPLCASCHKKRHQKLPVGL